MPFNALSDGEELVGGPLTPEELARERAELERDMIGPNEFMLGPGERVVFEEDGDTFHIERVEDVEGVLDWCKGRFNEGLANAKCEFRQIASYPPVILEIFGKKRGVTDPAWYLKRGSEDLMKELLLDRDLSGFRTLAGRY